MKNRKNPTKNHRKTATISFFGGESIGKNEIKFDEHRGRR